ncbi:MAG: AzlC family ABC transporter permease [Clostridia bacterium]|nr:AzlC family ABC transporter permease [Clostridia bacterium]
MKKTVLIALKKTLPVMAGYIVLGFGFGIICERAGYGILWALSMSLFIYAGSMQYVTVSLLTSGATLIASALTTLMVNARHLFYGISMVDKYKGSGCQKPYLIFSLTDETYSLVCSGETPDGVDFKRYSLLVSVFNQSYWIVGSLLGSLVGSLAKFNTAGVEFAMTALFITVFVEQWKSTKNHIPAILGVSLSLLCLLLFGSDKFLIPSMILISAALIIFRKKIERHGKEDSQPESK